MYVKPFFTSMDDIRAYGGKWLHLSFDRKHMSMLARVGPVGLLVVGRSPKPGVDKVQR